MSRYIAKVKYLEKPQQIVIWNGGSTSECYYEEKGS
jgi:hypothetical protein